MSKKNNKFAIIRYFQFAPNAPLALRFLSIVYVVQLTRVLPSQRVFFLLGSHSPVNITALLNFLPTHSSTSSHFSSFIFFIRASMASSDMASIDSPWSWSFRPSSFMDPWLLEAISGDTQTLTTQLQQSISNSDSFSHDTAEALSPFLSDGTPPTVPAPNHIDSTTKSRRSLVSVTGGKVSKRKPRKSKRSEMTFIYADPANFRQMVQQVTGARFIDAQLSQILKPEPLRPHGGRYLDTSASGTAPTYVSVTGGGGGDGLGFNSIACFPTLESWNNAM